MKGFNIETNSIDEFEGFVKSFYEYLKNSGKDNIVVGLVGDLGAGKTTFSKIIANYFGVKNDIQSPTFSIMKIYDTADSVIKEMVHIDAYRIDSLLDAQNLKINTYLQKPGTISLVEWPENIKEILPKETIFIQINHIIEGENPDTQKRQIRVLD